MLYIIQVLVYAAIMWLIYVVMLRNVPQHRFNRVYLISAAIIPFVLPLVVLPEQYRYAVNTPFLNMQLSEVVVNGGEQQAQTTGVSWLSILMYVYISIAFVLLSIQLWRLYKLKSVISNGHKIKQGDYTLLLNTGYGPGSWSKYIFLPDDKQEATIISHEKAHVELRHTWDIMFLSILQAVAWPNLFIHFIKKEITQVHEFQADSMVNMDSDDYSRMLLSSVFDTCTLPLSHSFIIHPIKRRIMMLHNRTRPRKSIQILTALSVALFIGGGVMLQSCQQEKKADVAKPELVTDFSTLTKMPECTYDLNQFMINNVEYPEAAKDQNIEGRIIAQFVIDENGKAVDVKIVNEEKSDPLLVQSALAAMKKMPDWKPAEKNGRKVRCMYTIPFVFKLPAEDKPQDQPEATADNRTNVNNQHDRRRRVAK